MKETEIVDYHHNVPCDQVWDKDLDFNIKKLLQDLLEIFMNIDYGVDQEFDRLMSMKQHENKTVKFFVDELSKL